MTTHRRAAQVFLCILMWCMALSLTILTSITMCGREAPGLELVAVSVAMLFTLPFVRDSMPYVPDVGIVIDLLGFFWCLALIALCTIVLLSSIVAQHVREFVHLQQQHLQQMQHEAQQYGARGV